MGCSGLNSLLNPALCRLVIVAPRPFKLVGNFDPESFGDPFREIIPFRDCKSPTAARAILREHVEIEVSALLDLLRDGQHLTLDQLEVDCPKRR